MKSARLEGRAAIVTGGTRGIGLAIARTFLDEGARVFVTGQSEQTVAAAATDLHAGECLVGCVADFSDPEAPARVVRAALAAFGRIDVLVNNAGVAGPVDMWTIDCVEWDRIQAVNLRAAFFCAREFAAAAKGGGHGGAVINLTSVAGQIGGVATGPAYVASKAGMIGLTRSLARHFAALGIRVNGIAPADIDTDMTAGWSAELRQRLAGMTPLARFGGVGEVAQAAAFLASEEASYITGQVLNVNGGIYMG
ncbi:MAG: glucose 1-dehydrogenase [Betaproteobacteria bacterium]|nr:glucose 1-dehydrogenase [Betaproteobacteria bacterium]